MLCKLRPQDEIFTAYLRLLRRCRGDGATPSKRSALAALEWCLQMKDKLEVDPCYIYEGERRSREIWLMIRKLRKEQQQAGPDKSYHACLQFALDILLWKLGVLDEICISCTSADGAAVSFALRSEYPTGLFRKLGELQSRWTEACQHLLPVSSAAELESYNLVFQAVVDWLRRKGDLIILLAGQTIAFRID